MNLDPFSCEAPCEMVDPIFSVVCMLSIESDIKRLDGSESVMILNLLFPKRKKCFVSIYNY